LRTVDPKASLAKSRKMCAAGDERHVRARLRQTSAEIAADAAASKDRNTHGPGNDTCVFGRSYGATSVSGSSCGRDRGLASPIRWRCRRLPVEELAKRAFLAAEGR